MLLLDITIHKASFINVISVIDKIDDLELIFRKSGSILVKVYIKGISVLYK